MDDGIFDLSDSEAEISRLDRPAERRLWTTPDGIVLNLLIPPTVYPPREDTDLLCQTLRSIGPGKGNRLLEIGCGSGAVSLYAASLGYKVRACDINPYAVAATRNNAEAWKLDVEAYEGGPGPIQDGDASQWSGTSPHDIVVWNLPYLDHDASIDQVLGPLEEAALLDTDDAGLVSRLMSHVRKNQLITKRGLLLLLVSGTKRGLETERIAQSNQLAARCIATHTFEDQEQLRVVAIWNPYAGSSVHQFDTLESTNASALDDGVVEGDLFISKQQTSGRGRRGRTWSSEEKCFAGTWLLRTTLPEIKPGLMQLMGGHAVLKTHQILGVPADKIALKWPNDVYIQTESKVGKAAGILVEGRNKGNASKVVIGIGVNLLLHQDQPEGYIAADLSEYLEGNQHSEHAAVLNAVIASYFERRSDVKKINLKTLTKEFLIVLKEGQSMLGEPFYRSKKWVIEGLNPNGNLVLSNDANERVEIQDGEDIQWSGLGGD
jgi:BirA family biotin operon repressor/biotin-[acetyl-CoA-carboxylase] ligase